MAKNEMKNTLPFGQENRRRSLQKRKTKTGLKTAALLSFIVFFLVLAAVIWGLWAWFRSDSFQEMIGGMNIGPLVLEFIFVSVVIVVLTLIFAIIMSNFIASPIKRLAKRAIKLSEGEFNVRFGKSKIEEIDKLCHALNFAADEFDKTESLRREFIANITHDLRTPLTMVKAYAEMIRDLSGAGNEKSMRHAQVIIDEAERLTSLVSDIQSLSKIKSGTDVLSVTEYDFNKYCQSIISQFKELHTKSGFTISYESPKGVFVRADADKIKRVLFNLIGNAINYAKDDDKQIKVSVSVTAGKFILVQIIDNGKGISEEELATVWTRYYRARQTKRTVSGSGLGLSIVREILEAHQVEYGAVSKLGEGTVFWFKLKLAWISVKPGEEVIKVKV
ncbi:MAG: HAMP domain-containing histidine kinase [Firmicutes bacterium]|nr:HAMP domain-containing histidine kinase [Bacillota bacterium]